jgi:hypothetical protein
VRTSSSSLDLPLLLVSSKRYRCRPDFDFDFGLVRIMEDVVVWSGSKGGSEEGEGLFPLDMV